LVTVAKTLESYRDWVYSHPDPTLVGTYMLPSSSYYAGDTKQLTTLRAGGWHTGSVPTEIDFIKVTRVPQPLSPFKGQPRLLNGHEAYSFGSITIVLNLTGGDYLDQAGHVVGHITREGPAAFVWTLAQGPDGQFRIADEGKLNPPGGIASVETP
jgi:hypothetical protein